MTIFWDFLVVLHVTAQETLQTQRFHAECCKTQVLEPYHAREGVKSGTSVLPLVGITSTSFYAKVTYTPLSLDTPDTGRY